MTRRRGGHAATIALWLTALVLFGSGAWVGPGSYPPSDAPEFVFYVSPVGHEHAALVRGLDGEIIEEYENFYLVKGSLNFQVQAQSHGLELVALPDFYAVELNGHRVDTRVVSSWRDRFDEPLHMILRLAGPVKSEWLDALRDRGISVREYVPNFAFISRVPSSKSLVGLDFVTWAGSFAPQYKVVGFASEDFVEKSAPLDVLIVAFGPEDLDTLNTRVLDVGGEVKRRTSGDYNAIQARISAGNVEALAREPTLRSIEPSVYPVAANTDATWVVQSPTLTPGNRPIFRRGILGAGQVIAVADDGLRTSHPAFSDPNVPGCPPQCAGHRKIVAYYVPGDAGGDLAVSGFHGTHTSGSAVGDVTPWNQYNGCDTCQTDAQRRLGPQDGSAPSAKLVFVDLDTQGRFGQPTDYWDLFSRAYTEFGARVHSNSWGSLTGRQYYGSHVYRIDGFVWSNPDLVVLFASGNEQVARSLREEAQAKSILTVGSTYNGLLANSRSAVSSRGPAHDGRLKPEILAPGHDLHSAAHSYATGDPYSASGGTSMATATLAGDAALVREYFMRGFYPSGSADIGCTSRCLIPSSALVRAVLVNGAVEIEHVDNPPYPNSDIGWGRANLENSLYFAGEPRKLFIDDNRAGLSTSQSAVYRVDISSVSQALEITLAWNDFPGAVGTGRALVNDLDLRITGPNGITYWGNRFKDVGSPGESVPGGNPDTLNPMENFLLLSPTAGTYYVQVLARNVAFGPQPYALVATGGILGAQSVQDSTPPQITSFSINGGAVATRETSVQLSLAASDPDSGLGVMRFRDGGAAQSVQTISEIAESTHGNGALWEGRQKVLEPFDKSYRCQTVIESAHPYPNQAGVDLWNLCSRVPDARFRVGFERIELAPMDRVQVMDDLGNIISQWRGTQTPIENAWTPSFLSASVRVNFIRNGAGNAWGFLGVVYDYDVPVPPAYPQRASGEWNVAEGDAHRVRLHFEYIELPFGDHLIIYDANGEAGRYIGHPTYRSDEWFPAEGSWLRGNLIRIEYVALNYAQNSERGFRLDFVRVFSGYARNYDTSWTVTDPGTSRIRGHLFRMELSPGDSLRYFDGLGVEYFCPCDPSMTPWIPGNTARIRITSNSDWETLWGFKIDYFESTNYPWTAWEAYGTTRAWDLPAGDGTKTVVAQIRDRAGNWVEMTDSIILDTVKPGLPSPPPPFDPCLGEVVTSGNVMFNWGTAQDPAPGSGVKQYRMQLYEGGVFQWEAVVGNPPYQRTIGNGDYAWHVRAEDYADNPGDYTSDCLFSVSLNSNGVLDGHVYNVVNQPVDGATVQVYVGVELLGTDVTDSAGFYQISSLPTETTLTVKVTRLYHIWNDQTTIIDPSPGQATLDFTAVSNANRLRGHVYDADTLLPIVNAAVRVYRGYTQLLGSTYSNGVGYYELWNLASNEVLRAVASKPYCYVDDIEYTQLSPGQYVTVDFYLVFIC